MVSSTAYKVTKVVISAKR